MRCCEEDDEEEQEVEIDEVSYNFLFIIYYFTVLLQLHDSPNFGLYLKWEVYTSTVSIFSFFWSTYCQLFQDESSREGKPRKLRHRSDSIKAKKVVEAEEQARAFRAAISRRAPAARKRKSDAAGDMKKPTISPRAKGWLKRVLPSIM